MKKAKLLIRDHIIYADLPDGRNWFLGVKAVPIGNGEPMYANMWTTIFSELVEGQGVWSKDECKRYIPIIDMDGTFIQYLPEANFWLEQRSKKHDSDYIDHTPI